MYYLDAFGCLLFFVCPGPAAMSTENDQLFKFECFNVSHHINLFLADLACQRNIKDIIFIFRFLRPQSLPLPPVVHLHVSMVANQKGSNCQQCARVLQSWWQLQEGSMIFSSTRTIKMKIRILISPLRRAIFCFIEPDVFFCLFFHLGFLSYWGDTL